MEFCRRCKKLTGFRALQTWECIFYSFSFLRFSFLLCKVEIVTHLSQRISARIENGRFKKKKKLFCMSSLVPDTSYVLLYPQSFHKLGIIIVPVFQMGPWGSQKLSNLAQKPLASKQQRWDVNSVWWQQILGVSPPHIAPHSAVTAAPSTPTLPHWLPLDHWDGEAVSYTLHWFISNFILFDLTQHANNREIFEL